MNKYEKKLTEHQHQAIVITWFDEFCTITPEFAHLYGKLASVPNGAFLAGNAGRRAAQMNKLKAEGLRPGYPDLQLLWPCGSYHGLLIEMKKNQKSTPRENQEEWLDFFCRAGYFATVCVGHTEAEDVIKWYLTEQDNGGLSAQ